MVNLRLKTQYIFGTGAVSYLETFLKINHFQKVMLLSGKRAIKENGLYDEIIRSFKKADVEWIEYNDIKPNPTDTEIMDAVKVARDSAVELIVAAGGGAVMDSSKIIALLAKNKDIHNLREYYEDDHLAKDPALPIVTIPTTAATGSENNALSVINLTDTHQANKVVFTSPSAIPTVCLEDSVYIASGNNWNIASGIFDTFTHQLEQYSGDETFFWTKQFLFGNMRTTYHYSLPFLKNHDNKEARDNLLWTATMSLNALSSFNSPGDWNIHWIEHGISAKWNVSHGAGLALITPTYIKIRAQQSEAYKNKILALAKEVFNINSLEAFLEFLLDWIKDLGLPTKWSDFKEIGKRPSKEDFVWLTEHLKRDDDPLREVKLSDAFILAILENIPE